MWDKTMRISNRRTTDAHNLGMFPWQYDLGREIENNEQIIPDWEMQIKTLKIKSRIKNCNIEKHCRYTKAI